MVRRADGLCWYLSGIQEPKISDSPLRGILESCEHFDETWGGGDRARRRVSQMGVTAG